MNYQKILDETLEKLTLNSNKSKLLLHACCAPCSSYVLEYLNKYFDITIYYYNPNIHPENEYIRRINELKKFIENCEFNDINLVEEVYNPKEYFDEVKGLENLGERSERCYNCYKFRMEKAVKYAKENNFDYFTTTLSISPYKNANKLNEIGEKLERKYDVKYLYADFKKKNGYRRSIELSKEYGLYRQDYCGCKYSRIARDKREALKRENIVKEVNKKHNETLIKKEMTISKNVVLSALVFILAFLFTKDFPISTYSSKLTNSSNSNNRIDNVIKEEELNKNVVIEENTIEEQKGYIDELYVYGQRLNIKGNIIINFII